jgi:hypothetical protein
VICWANGPFEAGQDDARGELAHRDGAVRTLLVPVGGPPEVVDLAGGGASGSRPRCGAHRAECVERIWITDPWEFWLDEDDAAAGKPVNQAATPVARALAPGSASRGRRRRGLGKDADASAALSPG